MPSTENTEGALIKRRPDQMTAPVQVYSTDNTIEVTWPELTGDATGNSEILSYNLLWDDGTSTLDIELCDTLVTSFTVTGLVGGADYSFKVRARNIYDYGDFSTDYLVEASDLPSKPQIPTVSLSGTDVIVAWIAPASHFAQIEQYEILFMKAD